MENFTPAALLAIEAPSEDALLLWVQTKVDRGVLQEIAAKDRGDDTAKHLAALQQQLRPRPPLGLLPWWPLEVLRLEMYSEPAPSAKGGQVKRLLAGTILLRNAAHCGSDDWSEEDFDALAATLLQLTRSALALDRPKLALGFILWLLEAQLYPGLRPFAAFCALILATVVGFGKASDPEILEICKWVDAEEQRYRNALGDDVYSGRWLVGLDWSGNKRDRKWWSSVAEQMFENPKRQYSERVLETLRTFSDRLAES